MANAAKLIPESGGLTLTTVSRPTSNQLVESQTDRYRPLLETLGDRHRNRYAQGHVVVARRPTYGVDEEVKDEEITKVIAIGLIVASLLCAGGVLLVGGWF